MAYRMGPAGYDTTDALHSGPIPIFDHNKTPPHQIDDMALSTDMRDADSSATTSSIPDDGVATPTTAVEALGDNSAIREWLLRSSETNDGFETFGSLKVTRTADPHADDTFLLIDKSQNRALASRNGHLHLENASNLHSEESISGRWLWLCTEKDGFKGFQNVAEKGFLGHDIWWDFYAKVPHHKGWENFVISRRESGYYWIQAQNWWTLWQVSARLDGRGLLAERNGGTLWEFIKIHADRTIVAP